MQENNNNCTGIAGIEGSSPNHWIFGRKKTIGSDPKESISKGFSNFYGGDNYPKETFGDTEKKHFSPPNASKEMDWRYQIRIIEEPQPLHKPVRKKLVSEPQKPKEKSTGKSSSFTSCNTNNNKEVLDFTNVPRPKKIIDEETGSRMSEKRGDEKPLEYFFTRKKNNLSKHSSPVITNNDEFYFSGKDVSLGLPPVSEFYIHPK
ncbi:hypothetical protein ABK040_008802 [Willaertia magna]